MTADGLIILSIPYLEVVLPFIDVDGLDDRTPPFILAHGSGGLNSKTAKKKKRGVRESTPRNRYRHHFLSMSSKINRRAAVRSVGL